MTKHHFTTHEKNLIIIGTNEQGSVIADIE